MGIMKNKKEFSFSERLYIPKILKGLSFNFREMFQKPVTRQYPEEVWHAPERFRGRPVLVVDDETGKERCVACGLCAYVCPPIAISLEPAETEDEKERYPKWFEINMTRCIFCGFCEEVCPEEAIIMSDEYELARYTREELIYRKDKLMIPASRLEKRLNYLHSKDKELQNYITRR